MPSRTPDELIAASIQEAEKTLASLDLTEEERAWAKAQGEAMFKSVTDRLFADAESEPMQRALVVPAAFAYALVMSRDWSAEVEKLRGSVD